MVEIIHKISDALRDSRICINITGGEPLLRKDLFDVLNVIEQVNNITDVPNIIQEIDGQKCASSLAFSP